MADVSVADQRVRMRTWLQRRGVSGPISYRETHVSILAFTPDRVWKCKKAVRFPFVDLSTAERRRANCEREVALNRRIAPDVYLGVVPLVEDDGTVVDSLVEMLRLPDGHRLSTLVEHDRAGAECVDRLADVLVRFHDRALTGHDIDAAATPKALAELWTRNFVELQPFSGSPLERSVLGKVNKDALRYLEGRSVLLAERIAFGRIRDGHGDLLADDVFCLPDGPRILDCLEFDDALRYGDVVADVAFLAMDLERLGHADVARRFLDRYRRAADDAWPESLEHFYIAYRSLVRAKVACLRADGDAEVIATARGLLGLAVRHLELGRVRLVLVGGPPAAGKSTLARTLAAATGWAVLRSDEVRKDLAGLAPSDPAAASLHQGIYSESWSRRTYAALFERARESLTRGQSVILDASWSSEARRSDAERLATETVSELSSFRCEVSAAVADARAAARARAGTDASDASAAIGAQLRRSFASWPEAVPLDGVDAPDALAEAVLARLGLATTTG